MDKTIDLSFSGLKNIISDEKQFTFAFGAHEIHINAIHAEFISPTVSNIHLSDPTINSLRFDIPINSEYFQNNEIISEDVISLFKDLSSGNSISVNEKQSIQMQLISVLIGNEELFHKLDDLYSIDFNISNIDHYIQNLQILIYFSTKLNRPQFNFTNLINTISSHFYLINEKDLLNLPKAALYSILSNENLKIESEDWLFDFMTKFLKDANEDDRIKFYETLYLNNLSESKFREFLLSIDSNEITRELWQKLCDHFLSEKSNQKDNEHRYSSPKEQSFPYDGNNSHAFEGIIRFLTQQSGGNVDDKGVVSVTGSSVNASDRIAKNAVNLDNTNNNFFRSKDEQNSWLQYDFKEHKIQPTHYSIMSPSEENGNSNPYSWVIEGRNENEEWTILDSRREVGALNSNCAKCTFVIQQQPERNKFYQYLRIRQTGPTAANRHYLGITALEYFGTMI